MEIKITETTNAKPGRVVGTYISEIVYEKLKAEADGNYMSVSNIVRKILYNYVNQEQNKEENKHE